jgi:phosphate starvation-inducible PhoH-like protein
MIVQKILSGIKGIKFIYFSDRDIVRHKIVQDIVKAYDVYENSKKSKDSKK